MTEWRPGVGGAWIMGLRHGLFCTGCCWLLMALLFVLGVMNVAWIAALTALVLLEKTLPSARWISVASGVAFIAWGAWLVRSAAQAG
jgi:predicted metal-binding membrane protein